MITLIIVFTAIILVICVAFSRKIDNTAQEEDKPTQYKLSTKVVMQVESSESSLYDKAMDAMLSGSDNIYVDHQTYIQVIEKWQEYQTYQIKLSRTTELNNTGIELEKANKYDDAIQVYEECVKLRYPATHAYERLMILYRKAGRYEDEQRVINIAVNVFGEENKRRADIAKKRYPMYASEIDLALETNEDVKGENNRYIFSQYKVMKYFDRYTKVQHLIDKNKSK